MNIPELLSDKRVCICGGAGGVGKTTTSAAIALGMAAEGAKVAVVTIDPARRLANALGLEDLGNTPRQVDPTRLAAVTQEGAAREMRGELWAMMLDSKRTFDELIERLAPDAARAAEIKHNRIYREISGAVSGSQEYTAISKLYELDQGGEFDLLVLDTPPSRNALDFLNAPGRLTSFLEGRTLRVFLRPSGVGMRVIGRGTGVLLGGLKRLSGSDLISDLSLFFSLLGEMTNDFSQRAHDVERLLRDDSTAIMLVTSAQRAPIDEAIWFRRTLLEGGLPFTGVVVNRYHHDRLAEDPSEVSADLAGVLGEDLAYRVADNMRDYHLMAERDARNVARLTEEMSGEPVLLVPHFDDDVHDVAGLLAMERHLFASDDERARLLSDTVA